MTTSISDSHEQATGQVSAHTRHYLDVIRKFESDPAHGYKYYHLMINFRIDGKVDADCFERAVHKLIIANPAFRSHFAQDGESWHQVIDAHPSSTSFERKNIQTDIAEWKKAARRLIDSTNEGPLDVFRGPLFKVVLAQFPDTAVFLVKFHHMICDGWGIIVALNQLLAFYEAELVGASAPIPTLPNAALLNFASEESVQLSGDSCLEKMKWWTRTIGDHSFVKQPLPGHGHGRLAIAGEILGSAATSQLMKNAEQGEFHFSYFAHAAFLKALSDFTGSRDLLVTFVRANRNELNQAIVGNFADWMMVRHRITAEQSLSSIAKQAQQDVAQAKENYLPYWHIVQEIAPGQYFKDFGITPYSFDYIPMFEPKIDIGGQASFFLLRDLEVLPVRVTATDIFCRANVIGALDSRDQKLGIDLLYHSQALGDRKIEDFLAKIMFELRDAAQQPL